MSRYDDFPYFPPSRPIETDQGIKARSKRGDFVENWWAQRWIHALEQLLNPGRLRRGRTYARKGQVLSIEETKNGIKAAVQGSQQKPYKVTIKLTALTDAQWTKVLDVLTDQAIFAAQLLAGEMPRNIEELFTTAGVNLFPEAEAELITNCSCPDYANPCKHVAAVHFILGERFDENPFMLFRLRGRSQEQILEALRLRRVDTPAPDDEFEPEAELDEPVPLTEEITKFWESGYSLTHLKISIKPPVIEFPILKRLGQPAFLQEDLLETLGPAYQAITRAAIEAAFGDEEAGEQSKANRETIRDTLSKDE